MSELGLTPVARTRLPDHDVGHGDQVNRIEFVLVGTDENGNRVERSVNGPAKDQSGDKAQQDAEQIELCPDL